MRRRMTRRISFLMIGRAGFWGELIVVLCGVS